MLLNMHEQTEFINSFLVMNSPQFINYRSQWLVFPVGRVALLLFLVL